MGTVNDYSGIRVFGKPHIYSLRGKYHSIWLYKRTVRGDTVGFRRNFQAAEFTARKNDYDLYGRLS